MGDDLIMFVNAAWVRVVKYVKIGAYSTKAILKGLTRRKGLGTFFLNGTR